MQFSFFLLLLLNLCSLNGSFKSKNCFILHICPYRIAASINCNNGILSSERMVFLGWISTCEEEVGKEEELETFQIGTVLLSVFPFHWCVRKEGKLRSHKIKGKQT